MQVSEFRLGVDGVVTAEFEDGSTKVINLANSVVKNPDGSLNSGASVVSVNSNSVAVTNSMIDVDASLGEVHITLPDVVQNAGKSLSISKKDSSSNYVRLIGNINGSSDNVITEKYTCLTLLSTGVEWRIV